MLLKQTIVQGALQQSAKLTRALTWMNARNAFHRRSDDTFIATYPRSGTTILQMILYQLTTSGEMDFQHISEVVPFLDRVVASGRDLEALPSPRIFKTHLPFDELKKWKGRYIYVEREGADVFVSNFHLYRTHLNYRGTIEEFFTKYVKGDVLWGSWFSYTKKWRKHLDNPNVLSLRYEDLVKDPASVITKISNFCGLAPSEEVKERVNSRSSFGFMKSHEHLFDPLNEIIWEVKSMPRGNFIRSGKPMAYREELSEELISRFERVKVEIIGN